MPPQRKKNEDLKRGLDAFERREQSRSSDHTYNQEKSATVQTHTQQACWQQTKRTHIVDDDDDPKGHPFIDEIMEAQLPYKWKGLNIKLSYGSTDPNKHMNVYKTQMNLYTTNKRIWWKVFPTSLKEGALSLMWFQ